MSFSCTDGQICQKLLPERAVVTYNLELPEDLKRAGLTPIFHPWKLYLAPNNPYPGQVVVPQSAFLITEDDEEEHEESEVLEDVDCRETRRYGVRYKATDAGDWEEWNAKPPWQPWCRE